MAKPLFTRYKIYFLFPIFFFFYNILWPCKGDFNYYYTCITLDSNKTVRRDRQLFWFVKKADSRLIPLPTLISDILRPAQESSRVLCRENRIIVRRKPSFIRRQFTVIQLFRCKTVVVRPQLWPVLRGKYIRVNRWTQYTEHAFYIIILKNKIIYIYI